MTRNQPDNDGFSDFLKIKNTKKQHLNQAESNIYQV